LNRLVAIPTTNLVHDATFKPARDSRIDKPKDTWRQVPIAVSSGPGHAAPLIYEEGSIGHYPRVLMDER
jgi:hypothetical protein